MSTDGEQILKSFDSLPESERHEVASEILRRTYKVNIGLDETELAGAYAQFADEDRELAERGIADYEKGLTFEDGQ